MRKERREKRVGIGAFSVKLIQTVWNTGRIPQQMMWTIIVLIPKCGGNFRGIGLLEPFWKVIECVIDFRLKRVNFHDCLHGFVSVRGTGTATLEAKLAQQLAYIEQPPCMVYSWI